MADTIWNSHHTVDPGDSVTAPKSRARTLDLRAYKTHKGNRTPLSIADTSLDSCTRMYNEAMTYQSPGVFQLQKAFDTLKRFIESCPFDPRVPNEFFDLDHAASQVLPHDTLAYLGFRMWLESVLYLNTVNPEYFCACVEDIAGTFYSNGDTGRNILLAPNRGLAVDQWLIQNTTCDTPYLARGYSGGRYAQYKSWLNDTSQPLDTTLPTMAQLGLDTLLNRYLLNSAVKQPQGFISNVAASPNPVSTGTIISFGISKEDYVKIEVFDILGNRVSSAGFESLFEPGNKAVPISLQGLPSGTYFARIVTAYGEVQTVKLVKE